ncbi:hypothetical protein B0H13DRAFT_2511633 [Mycena leptocephala]|nr:hypothetical protein B0H13DRAFT_2511633 [Mycena leptocephala]
MHVPIPKGPTMATLSFADLAKLRANGTDTPALVGLRALVLVAFNCDDSDSESRSDEGYLLTLLRCTSQSSKAARERARNSTSSIPDPSHAQLESPPHPHLGGGADEHRRKVRRTHLFRRICANSHYPPFARCWPADCSSRDPRRAPDAGIDPDSCAHGRIPSHPCPRPGPPSDSNPSLLLPRSNPLRPIHIDPARSSAHPACPLARRRSRPYSSTPLLPRRLALPIHPRTMIPRPRPPPADPRSELYTDADPLLSILSIPFSSGSGRDYDDRRGELERAAHYRLRSPVFQARRIATF